ncbi:Fumarylacetoacetase [Plasmopara halstedii]|uniref:Fumarylacetoacetase n=1 Tax=Plasmopara halstedii TaxID=4781 RepID=A0A0N7L4K2_PLAHL|nr:Fumarylacetoacetase [Plasmopara halstedii]CEG38907.1 Fumarylacetoacetase [Plasmopara halstedii]|eukprot:XP_024575276.1 Fumarylacetoacetase [Plasmopara halstedii]
MNDWSARDIQKWDGALGGLEAVPSFGPAQKDPKPLPYLSDPNYAHGTYDIKLNVSIKPEGSNQAYTVTKE